MQLKKQQRGYVVWVVLLVLLGMMVGAWQYNRIRTENRLQAQQAAEQKALDQRKEVERKELERRVAEEKQQRDVLSVSHKVVEDTLSRWDDAVKVASTSSRIALPAPVGVLQAIRRDAEQLSVPPCMDQAKAQLVLSMESTIKGFLVFMRNELKLGEVLAQADFDEAAKHMADFKTSRSACPK